MAVTFRATDFRRYTAEACQPHPRKWPTPGALAKALDHTTRDSLALQVIDRELVKTADHKVPAGGIMIFMSPQEGKLVSDDTPIPTPTGWTTHGTLKPGDEVFHPSGKPIRVLAVSEPAQATLLVRTSDHGAIKVHPRHEWTVYDRSRGQHGPYFYTHWRTVDTAYLLAQRLSSGPPDRRGSNYRFHLPPREPLELPDADLPIDPYTLGVWLGDGSSTKAAITHHPDDQYDLPYPLSARCTHPTTGIITTYYAGGMMADLRAAGVWGKDSKHIPAAYLRASEKQRRSLLAGLIDTDGHVAAAGQVSFDNANERMVRDTAELLRTLGYRAHVHRPTAPKLTSSGIQGKQAMWRVTYTPHDEGPARLPRKATVNLGNRRRVAITSIEPCDPAPGRCITVDSPDGLYLAGEQFTPTHNSQRVSRRFPEWLLSHNPSLRIAIVSYELESATRWGRQILRDIRSADPAILDIQVMRDSSAAGRWDTPQGGGVYCVGVGGALTGRPVDVLLTHY